MMPSNKRFVPNEQFYTILYTSMTLNKVAENCYYFFLFGSLSKIYFTHFRVWVILFIEDPIMNVKCRNMKLEFMLNVG